jgi:hypothetical protein
MNNNLQDNIFITIYNHIEKKGYFIGSLFIVPSLSLLFDSLSLVIMSALFIILLTLIYELGFILKATDKALVYLGFIAGLFMFSINIYTSSLLKLETPNLKSQIYNLELKSIEINSTLPINKLYLDNIVKIKTDLVMQEAELFKLNTESLTTIKTKFLVVVLTFSLLMLVYLMTADIVKLQEKEDDNKEVV